MRIAIIGADGQLGSDLVKVLQPIHGLVPLTIADIEVTDPASIGRALRGAAGTLFLP